MAMTIKEQANLDEAILMNKTSEAKIAELQGKLDAQEDTRPFEIMVKRVDGTNKFNLVIPYKNYSAQLVKRDNNTLVATKEWVHSEEETNSNEAVRKIIEDKYRFDNLATQKNVASQGDVPSAS